MHIGIPGLFQIWMPLNALNIRDKYRIPMVYLPIYIRPFLVGNR